MGQGEGLSAEGGNHYIYRLRDSVVCDESGPSGFVSDVSESFGALIGRLSLPFLHRQAWACGRWLWRLYPAFPPRRWWSLASVCSTASPISTPGRHGRALQPAGGSGLRAAECLRPYGVLPALHACMAAIATIKKETGSWRWTLGLALFQIGVAWAAAVIVFPGGKTDFWLIYRWYDISRGAFRCRSREERNPFHGNIDRPDWTDDPGLGPPSD